MTILVTGATGSVGRLLVDELTAAGAPVRALTNNPKKAALPVWCRGRQGLSRQPGHTARGTREDRHGLPGATSGIRRRFRRRCEGGRRTAGRRTVG